MWRLEAKLPPADKDPEVRAARIAEDEQRVQAALDKAQEEPIRLRTLIEQAGVEGLYGKLAVREETLAAVGAHLCGASFGPSA